MSMIKILIADDHTIFRQGVSMMLSDIEDFDVVAEADNGRAAVKLAGENEIDVALLDISMPELNGIEATKQILNLSPNTKIITLSMHEDPSYVSNAFAAGAKAYVIKGADIDDLVRAIRAVIKNRSFLSPQIAGIVVDGFSQKVRGENEVTLRELSDREREILQLIAEGKSSKEIGSVLYISAGTVDKHRKNIMAKLNLHSIAELTKYAIRNGLTSM